MSNGSMLPPDIQEQVARKKSRVGGVGAAAHENVDSARKREVAMGVPPEPSEPTEPEVAEDPDENLLVCPNERCLTTLKDEWDFCAKCGRDLVREGAAKRLGLSFSDEDVQDYIFKGYIVRDLKVLGNHTATAKTSQPTDLHEVDQYIMEGKWAKNEDGSERKVSDFYMRQVNSLAFTAASIQKFDGESIGKTFEERMAWLMARGSALADMLSTRVVWFNQAVTKFLESKDALPGS